MYRLDIENSEVCYSAHVTETSGMEWHKKLGHASYTSMKYLKDIILEITIPVEQCETCLEGKLHRKPFKKSESESNCQLEIIHMDVCSMPDTSIGGHKYFLTMIDDFSKKVAFYPICSKADVFEKFKEYTALAENQTGESLKAIRSDNGTEFINKKFNDYCLSRGIVHQKSAPYTPQQNGVAERYNRTILERIRTMLLDAKLPKSFWGEAGNTAVLLLNMIPKQKGDKSAEEKYSGKTIKSLILHKFGEKALAFVPKEKRSKLDSHTIECLFMGYEPSGYRLYCGDPLGNSSKIIISRDVAFPKQH